MEVIRLVNQLRKCEDDVFQVWLCRMRKAGYSDSPGMNRREFCKRFDSVMSALEEVYRSPQKTPFARPDGVPHIFAKEIIEELSPGKNGGLDLELFLVYFKTMISCIEDRIPGINLTSEQTTDAVLKLRKIADLTEMHAIADWKRYRTVESGTIKGPPAQTTSEKILGAIFMSVGDGILLVDEDYEIVKANQRSCEIYGLPQQNIIGTDIRSLAEDTGAELLTQYFEELIEGQRKSAEITCLYVDGKSFPATVTVTRSDFDGKRHWPIIVRDDTSRKALEMQLRQEKQQTEEMNMTLKTVMKSIEQDRKDFENRVAAKISTSLLPSLKKIEKAPEANVRKSYLALLEEQLVSLTTGFEKELDAGLLKLTRTEIEVCKLIQAGCSSKDICEAMSLSFDTIQTHRKNIRRKLALNGKKLNLHAFLMNRNL